MAAPAYTFHAVTDVGRGREQNEDACGEVEAAGGELLVVCDGMGGHESGEVASRIAVDAIMQIFQNSPASDPSERLKNGFLVANQRILAHAEKAGLDGMGTTAVAAFVRDGEAWIGHVGDSRAYHLRGGSVLWRTADHTRVQKMIDRGILTPEQAKTHEDANVVTRALGFARGEEQPEPDIEAGRELRDGDLLLLCSDGLYDLVRDEEIAELGSEDTPAEAAQHLVDLANRRGGHDNITVTIMRWGEGAVRKGGARKTDLDEAGPSSSAMKTTDVAKSAAAAKVIVAREKAKEAAAATATEPDARSKKAAVLVIGGLALVGIAAAVFFLTRGDSEQTNNPARDAGAGGTQPGAIDAAAGTDPDGGAAGTAPDGGTLTAPVWDQPKTGGGGGGGGGKKGSGSGSGAGSGSSTGSGAGSGAGSGSTPGTGTGTGTGTGSAAGTGSGSGSGLGAKVGAGFATKLGAGKGSGSGATAGSGATTGSGAATPSGAGAGSGAKPTTPPSSGGGAGSGAKSGTGAAPAPTGAGAKSGASAAPAPTGTGTKSTPAPTSVPTTGGAKSGATGATAPTSPATSGATTPAPKQPTGSTSTAPGATGPSMPTTPPGMTPPSGGTP